MKRTRFKTNRLASSDNYQRSKELHVEYLREFHNNHIEEINSIKIEQKYVRVFGKLIPVTFEQTRMYNTLNFI